MHRLHMIGANVGEVREGWVRIWEIRDRTTERFPSVVLQLGDELGAPITGWIWQAELGLARDVKVGDWVHVRGRITNRWQSGHSCIDLDDIRSERSDPDEDADQDLEAWVDRPTIHLDLTPEVAGHLLRLLSSDPETSGARAGRNTTEDLRALEMYLRDVVPPSVCSPLHPS